ncbi:MAG: ABC transporter ATP-binding protein [Candidatus Aquicultorales bacterium]
MDPILSVRELSKDFKGVSAVAGVSFDAYPGEVFGLLGPNGAGKTTTIRMIATLLSPTSGSARVCGFDVRSEPESVRATVGVLTTDIGVYDRLSGRENLGYFGELYGIYGQALKKRIGEISDALDMEEFIDKRAGTYSTGMKQKLAIARSVIHDPRVVIFDEPTSGLDVLASQTVLAYMKHAADHGKLVVLSTHQMSDAERLCDRSAIMHRGKLLALDRIEKLKESTGTRHLEDAFLALVNGAPAEVTA